MSRRVALVTDSTAYLSPELVRRFDIAVVPVQVVVGDTSYDEGVGLTAAELVEAMHRRARVTTSRPAPSRFLRAYQAAAEAGAGAVVSVHLSARLSATYESASLAAREAPLPVHLLDSRTLGMGLGFGVLAAAVAAAAGGTAESVAAAARKRAEATSIFFYVDTLEYLRRGGRIGAASAALGTALHVKPLLHVADGGIALLEKVRTTTRALSRLVEVVTERVGGSPVDVAIHHLGAPERAAAMAERLQDRLPGVREVSISEVGPVVGAHVGPGTLAVVVAPHLDL